MPLLIGVAVLVVIAGVGWLLWARGGEAPTAPTSFRKDPRRAEAEFRKACDANVADGCTALADLYVHPLSPVDGKVLPVRKKACELGSAKACTTLGKLLREGDYGHRVNVDSSGATQAYARACELGDGEGCTSYGFALSKGQGANIDREAARKAFERACELKDSAGCEAATKP